MRCVFPVRYSAVVSMRPCCDFISGFSPGKDFLARAPFVGGRFSETANSEGATLRTGCGESRSRSGKLYCLLLSRDTCVWWADVFFMLCIAVVVCCCRFVVVAGAPVVVGRRCCWWPSSDVGDLAGRNAEEGLGVFRGRGQGTHTSTQPYSRSLIFWVDSNTFWGQSDFAIFQCRTRFLGQSADGQHS